MPKFEGFYFSFLLFKEIFAGDFIYLVRLLVEESQEGYGPVK
jgi:hypothetical protein